MAEDIAQLKLEHQICFPLYAVSRLITQQYKSLLQELCVTYPQYLVLLVLWEHNDIPIKQISEKLFLETNTLTPLLKRMETNGMIQRKRSAVDERMVTISLTKLGRQLRDKAQSIPDKLINKLDCFDVNEDDIIVLKRILDTMLTSARQG